MAGSERELIGTYIRGNSLVLISQLLIAMRGVVLVPLVVKTFNAEVYGAYVLLISMVGFAIGLSSLGAGYQFTRHAPSTDDLARRRSLFLGALLFNLITIAALGSALLPAHPLIEIVLLKRKFPFPVGPVVLLLFSQTVLHHYANYFRYTHRTRTFVLATTVQTYLFIAIVFLISRLGSAVSVGQLILLQAASLALVAPFLVVAATREMWFRGPLLKTYNVRTDLRVGFPVVGMFVVDFALSNSDRYVLAAFHTVESVGAYNVAYVVGTIAMLVPKSLGVMVPALLARAEDNGGAAEVGRLLGFSIHAVLLFSVPFVVGAAVYGWEVLALLATAEIADAAYPAMVAAAVAVVFYGQFTVRGFLLYVKQRTVALFIMSAAAAVLNLALNFAILPFYQNILVPALTTVAAYVLADGIGRRATANDQVPKVRISFILKVAIASLGIAAFRPIVAMSDSAAVLFGCVAGSALLYFILLFVLRVVPREAVSSLRMLRGSGAEGG